ncbi:DUF1758 domain-containing protein [Trichonephila clavipes]|nr:DUF1758 domain-containing protein [Trichonephila clavipes]
MDWRTRSDTPAVCSTFAIAQMILATGVTALAKQMSAEKYRDRFTELCAKIYQLATKETSEIVTPQRKFKLPKIELKKCSGDAKEYLTFWTQFRKIDEDSSIPPEDKFQFLQQAVVPKSTAARVVESFPATADSYPKAISPLKDRFGREDLLVQIYDELESKIRALESFGRTQEKYGDFLSLLVESCLPEEILIAWERFRNLNEATDAWKTCSLEQLLSFLNKEVRGEQLIELALPGFASGSQNLFRITELIW